MADDFDEMVGRNIRKCRLVAGMSQTDLAEALSTATGERMHQQTILKIEKGTRPLRFAEVVEIARIFGVPLDDMIDYKPEVAAVREQHRRLSAQRKELEEALSAYSERTQVLASDLDNDAVRQLLPPDELQRMLQDTDQDSDLLRALTQIHVHILLRRAEDD